MAKIDKIDKKILFELDKNSRRSVKEIAKKLKINRDTLAYRIKQLEKNSIIKNYYTLLDYSKLGYQLIRVYFKFQNTTKEIEEEITKYLVQSKSTLTIYKTEGDWDLVTCFLVKTLHDFYDTFKTFKEQYKKYIHTKDTAIMTQFVHYLRNYLVDPDKADTTTFTTGKSEKIEIDETDFQILKLISDNAKIPLIELGNKLKMTSMAVHYRLKQLEKNGIILSHKALIDYSRLNYEYYKIDFEIEDLSKLKQLQQFAKNHPNIIYEDITVGGSDFEFDAELPNHEEFYNLIEEIKEKFPKLIRTYKYYKARKIYKYIYFPE